MKIARLLLLLATLLAQFSPLHLTAADSPGFTRKEIIYGRKFGTALTFDVIQPTETNNHCSVLFMVSGGFFSSHDAINPGSYKPFLKRGYTIFAIVHGSQPRFIIPEITEDIHRAIRFIRSHAADYGVDPLKFGISGGSAGGHLSLTMGTQGGPGKADAKDPIDRESSAVQAVACFFPPTDFLNYSATDVDAVGIGILKDFKPAFGPGSDTAESRQTLGKQISPIYFITTKMPPTLIIHGDADTLVPIQQAEIFVKKATDMGIKNVKLHVKPGAGHGWTDMAPEMELLAEWFDTHLRGLPAKTAAQ